MAESPKEITFDVNVRLWGPRPYTERSAEDGIPRFDFKIPIRKGNPDTADIEVEVMEFGDGEREIHVRCLCHACETLANGDSMDDVMKEDGPGIYYMRAWYEHYPSTPNGPGEWDAGWEIAPPSPVDELRT